MISVHVCDRDQRLDTTFKAGSWQEIRETFLKTIGAYVDGQCHHIRMFDMGVDPVPANVVAIAMERPDTGAYAMVYPLDGAPYSSTGTWPETRDWLDHVLAAGDVAGIDIVGNDPVMGGTMDQGDIIVPDAPELVGMPVTMVWDINHVDPDPGDVDVFL